MTVESRESTGLRLGILGAARIAGMAVLRPACNQPDASVVALASRDPQRAKRLFERFAIPKVCGSYDEVITDPEINAVYVPLPNSLHLTWSLRALEAGKHVLCEKPMALNQAEAREMVQAAQKKELLLAEAMHFRYHPLAQRIREILQEGSLGEIRHVEARVCFPVPRRTNIRYNYSLGGGAMMDLGCYAASLLRLVEPGEPEVVRAEALIASPNVDRYMEAELGFPSGITARLQCSLWSRSLLGNTLRVRGSKGELAVLNPLAPHAYHRITLTTGGKTTKKWHGGGESTYSYQLRAFAAAVAGKGTMETGGDDAIANMGLIDAVYRKAGLSPRGRAAMAA